MLNAKKIKYIYYTRAHASTDFVATIDSYKLIDFHIHIVRWRMVVGSGNNNIVSVIRGTA